MWIIHDQDEWEVVSESNIDGYMFGHPIGSASIGWRRRDPVEVAKIKAARQEEHERQVLAEADAIRASRLSD